MALQGNIDSFPLVDVLGLLSGSHKTGRLVVNADRCESTLWLAEGAIVGATSAALGAAPTTVEPSEALFDLLRCREGAFYFENDLECADPDEPVAANVAIETAQRALVEWNDITAVVPGLTSPLTLRPTLDGDEVTLDGRLWGGLVALVSVAVRDHGVANAGAFVEYLGLGELDALRLAFDLVDGGLIELAPLPDVGVEAVPIGDDVDPALGSAAGSAPAAAAGVAPVAAPEVAPAEHGVPEYSGVAMAGLPAVNLPAPGTNGFLHPGLAAPPAFDVIAPAVAAGVGGLQPPAVPRNLATAAQEDSEAELARQLAMLSPRAAEAVAGADATTTIEEVGGPRVARFFDTA
ncbi:MAG: DUF4388 domain-containing protein [Actinobacteria bacterium]|nr:DUF4388 domain-containing protein [Actinomycetota bacterium]